VRASLEEVGDKKAYMGNDAALFYLSLDGRFNTPVNLRTLSQFNFLKLKMSQLCLFTRKE
jgi:hypothetical protein